MPEVARLLSKRLDQRRMGVPQHVDGNAAGKVDQFAAALIPHARTGATYWNKGSGCIVGHHDLVEIGALYRVVLDGHLSSPDKEHLHEQAT
jgi:hypothetical protein